MFAKISLLFSLIFIFSCSNDRGIINYESNSNRSVVHSEQGTVIGGTKPEMLEGGSGVTIGNGNSNEDEVEDEISDPAMVIGAYLSCSMLEGNKVSCQSEKVIGIEDLDKLILLDENNQEIPKETLDLKFNESQGLFELIITVPDDYKLKEIKAESQSSSQGCKQEEPPILSSGRTDVVAVFQAYSSSARDHLQSFDKQEANESYTCSSFSFYVLSGMVGSSHELTRCHNVTYSNHYLTKTELGCEAGHFDEGAFGFLFSDASQGKPVYLCHSNILSDSHTTTEACKDGYEVKEVLGYTPN